MSVRKINSEERDYILAICVEHVLYLTCSDMVLSHYEESIIEWALSPEVWFDVER